MHSCSGLGAGSAPGSLKGPLLDAFRSFPGEPKDHSGQSLSPHPARCHPALPPSLPPPGAVRTLCRVWAHRVHAHSGLVVRAALGRALGSINTAGCECGPFIAPLRGRGAHLPLLPAIARVAAGGCPGVSGSVSSAVPVAWNSVSLGEFLPR